MFRFTKNATWLSLRNNGSDISILVSAEICCHHAIRLEVAFGENSKVINVSGM